MRLWNYIRRLWSRKPSAQLAEKFLYDVKLPVNHITKQIAQQRRTLRREREERRKRSLGQAGQ